MARRPVLVLIAGLALVLGGGCSSAPKGPAIVFTLANEAADLVKLGAAALRRGDSAAATGYYQEAWRLYTAIDDAEGRIRSLDGLDQLGIQADETEENITLAARIARERVHNGPGSEHAAASKELSALAALIEVRQLLAAANSPAAQEGTAEPDALRRAQDLAAVAAAALERLPRDRARALCLEAELAAKRGDYLRALALLDGAVELWSKPLDLAGYAYARYLFGSVLSRMGRLDEAYEALLEALDHDRKAENGQGLAETCHALALVSKKQGNDELAASWDRRSRDIYRALDPKSGPRTAPAKGSAEDTPSEAGAAPPRE